MQGFLVRAARPAQPLALGHAPDAVAVLVHGDVALLAEQNLVRRLGVSVGAYGAQGLVLLVEAGGEGVGEGLVRRGGGGEGAVGGGVGGEGAAAAAAAAAARAAAARAAPGPGAAAATPTPTPTTSPRGPVDVVAALEARARRRGHGQGRLCRLELLPALPVAPLALG